MPKNVAPQDQCMASQHCPYTRGARPCCAQELLGLAEVTHKKGDIASEMVCPKLIFRTSRLLEDFVQSPRDLRCSLQLSASGMIVTKGRKSSDSLRRVFRGDSQFDHARECFARVRRALSLVQVRVRSDCHL